MFEMIRMLLNAANNDIKPDLGKILAAGEDEAATDLQLIREAVSGYESLEGELALTKAHMTYYTLQLYAAHDRYQTGGDMADYHRTVELQQKLKEYERYKEALPTSESKEDARKKAGLEKDWQL